MAPSHKTNSVTEPASRSARATRSFARASSSASNVATSIPKIRMRHAIPPPTTSRSVIMAQSTPRAYPAHCHTKPSSIHAFRAQAT